MASDQLRVLIADDNATDRLLLRFLLRGLGHEAIEAGDGEEAIRRFTESAPSLVILADELPVVDGPEVGRRIRQLAGDDFVALIYSTAHDNAASLNRCLAAGGDDFLLKPFNGVVLRAKLNALLRMMQMHRTLRHQHREIADHNAHLLREQEIAKRIFDRVAHAGCLNLPNIRYHLSPMAVFNGDVVLAATGPSGNLVVLHGDFTGHGLAAAIGAMPLAQTFYGMVSKGFSLREVLSEINLKLYEILPTEVFCCACAVDIDFTQQRMQYWNGGLPDCYLYRAASADVERLVSHDLPLGIRTATDFDLPLQITTVAPGDRIFLWSDGIVEATNPDGQAFGDAGLQRVFGAAEDSASLFDALTATLAAHVQDRALADDLSVVEIVVVPESEFAGMAATQLQAFAQPPLDWSVAYEFRADSLRYLNQIGRAHV